MGPSQISFFFSLYVSYNVTLLWTFLRCSLNSLFWHFLDIHVYNKRQFSYRTKRKILTQFYIKSPYNNIKLKTDVTTQNATKMFHYTSSADRFRTVRGSNSAQTGMGNRLTGPTFPLTAKTVQSKGHAFENV